ncbi:hypothetical protein ACFX2F_021831 [Malus domestica]
MQNLNSVLIARGLEHKIKVTTPHSNGDEPSTTLKHVGQLTDPEPPSYNRRSRSEIFRRYLAGVPWISTTIGGLKNPEYLWFNSNQLYSTLPSEISNCSTP